MSEREIEITTLGHRGDGVAETETGPIYVAGALPGEIVRAKVVDGRAQKPVIEKPSPDRIEPVCRHYSACGGCSVQHLAEEPYLVWKSGLVEKALRDRGIETEVSG
ncbi:MAG: TRAM domain-containing protein, partial [Pseudomonadota bacterium]|nr:TRAM domain-containing protein [Pseudomonadota bacterium]